MYSFVLNKILLPLGSVVFSGNYSKYLREWNAYDRMDAKALEKLQQEKMRIGYEQADNARSVRMRTLSGLLITSPVMS